jgi:hypothetical protein
MDPETQLLIHELRQKAKMAEDTMASMMSNFDSFVHGARRVIDFPGGSREVQDVFTDILAFIKDSVKERADTLQKNRDLQRLMEMKVQEQTNVYNFPRKAIQLLPDYLHKFKTISAHVSQYAITKPPSQ